MIKKKFYVARDKDGELNLFVGKKPKKQETYYTSQCFWFVETTYADLYKDPKIELPKTMFPKTKWEDNEPTEVSINLPLN